MTVSDAYTFRAELWEWHGQASWHFVSLPEQIADEIEALGVRHGFGSVPVEVRTEVVEWHTSLFPDRKAGTYLLPLKKSIRQQLGWREGSRIEVTLQIRGL